MRKKRLLAAMLSMTLACSLTIPGLASQDTSFLDSSISSEEEAITIGDSENTEELTPEELKNLADDDSIVFADENGEEIDILADDSETWDDKIVLSENNSIVEVTNEEAKNEETDALTEKYIEENINPEYAEFKSAHIVDAIYAKQTLFDLSVMEEGDTPESILHNIEFGGEDNDDDLIKLLTQTSTVIAVYDVDEESDYYVSFLDTLHDNNGVKWLDSIFTENNELGNVIDGCIYDNATGIAYLPKSLFDIEEGIMAYSAQLMYGIQTYEDVSVDVDSVSNGEKVESYTTVNDLIDVGTSIQAEKGMSEEDLNVSVNGVPIEEDYYEYDPETGRLDIGIPPASCGTVSVKDTSNAVTKTARAMFNTVVADAASYNSLTFYKKAAVAVPDEVKDGALFIGNIKVMYGPQDQIHTGTEIDPKKGSGYYSLKGGLTKLIRAVETGSINVNDIKEHTYDSGMFDFRFRLKNNTLRQKNNKKITGAFLGGFGDFLGECVHNKSSLLNSQSVIPDEGIWYDIKSLVRVFKIDRTAKNPYIVIGIVTSNSNTQAGVGLYKLHITVGPQTQTVNATQAKNFSENVTVQVTKKDAATGAVLPGAKFQISEDDQNVVRAGAVVTDNNGIAKFTYTRYSGNISKTSKNYTYVTNWSKLSSAQKKACTNKGWYSKKADAVKAANAEVSTYMTNQQKAFLNKAHTWFVKETEAPINHYLNSTILKLTEAAGQSTVSGVITNGTPYGSIRINKTNIDGTSEVKSKDPKVTLEGAVFGVYATSKILKTDNKTQAYAANQLVTTVTITNHRDGYYGVASNLLPGSYYVKEISNPYGYKINVSNSGNITLAANRTSTATAITQQAVTIKDEEKELPLTILKYKRPANGAAETLESGAMFKITDSYGNMLYADSSNKATYDRSKAVSTQYTVITGSSGENLGKATLDKIPIGNYTIEQVGEEGDYTFISPQSFEVSSDVNELEPIKYTFYNNEVPRAPRLKIIKNTRINDSGTQTYVEAAENGIVFDVYINYDNESKTGDLVDVLVSGATSDRGNEMTVINASDIEAAHAEALNYAAYLTGKTDIEPSGVYSRGNDGEAISRIISDDAKYTIVQVNKSNGYKKLDPFSITVPENGKGFYGDKGDAGEKNVRYNDFEGEKIVINKVREDIKGAEYKETGAKFSVLDIGKIKQLEQTSEYDSQTYGTFPYEEYLQEGEDLDQAKVYRQNLSVYLAENNCVLNVMETDNNGHAEMIIMPDSYLYQYDDSVSQANKGIALLQTDGYSSVAMEPVLTSKDAIDSNSENTANYEYAARARTDRNITVYQYNMTDKPNKVGYVVLYKYMTNGVDNRGSYTTEPEGNAVFQILNADTEVLVQTMPATKNNGYTKSSALPYGRYIIRQVRGAEGHELADDQIVEINKNTIDKNKVLCVAGDNEEEATFTQYEFSLPEWFDAPAGFTATPEDNGKSDLIVSFAKSNDDKIERSANSNVKVVRKTSYDSSLYDEGYEVVLRSENEKHDGRQVTTIKLFHKKGSENDWVMETYNGSAKLGTEDVSGIGESNVTHNTNKIKKINKETPVELRLIKKTTGEYDRNGREITDHYLNDATFRIINKHTGKSVAYLTTGKNEEGEYVASLNGKALKEVLYGDYIVREVVAPDGYKETEEEIEINAYTIKYDRKAPYFEVEIEDEPVFGKITGIKTGDSLTGKKQDANGTSFVYTEKVLPGATYQLYAKEDITSPDGKIVYHKAGDLISTATSDVTGELEFRRTLPDGTQTENMYLGEYYVVETNAPEGYVVDPTEWDVTLTINDDADAANNAEQISVSDYEINDDNKYAYAVLDEEGTLTFFRSNIDYTKYVDEFSEEGAEPIDCTEKTDEEVGINYMDCDGIAHSGKLYTNFESLPAGSTLPWAEDAENIIAVTVAEDQVIRPNTTANWFKNCENLESANVIRIDTKNITNMSDMFSGCSSLVDLRQSFNTSNVTNTSNMFKDCNSVKFFDLSHWDTGKLSNTTNMFSGDSACKYIFVSDKWDAAGIANSTNMFAGCGNLTGFDASEVDASKASIVESGGYLTKIAETEETDD